MHDETLLLRQVNPSFVVAGRVTSQVFHPTPKDKDLLSAYDGDLIGPEASWAHFTRDLGHKSVGVLAVTAGECQAEDLPARPDPELFAEHAVIDFTGKGKKEKKRAASMLRDKALARDWLFQSSPA